MAPKRAAQETAVASKASKKAKVDPIASKCQEVVKALHDAELPTEVLQMLVDAIPHCLVPAPRHPFQERAIAMIDGILGNIRSKLEADVSSTEEARLIAKQQLAESTAAYEEVQRKLAAAKAYAADTKAALAKKAQAFQEGKAALAEQQAQQQVESSELDVTAEHKQQLEAMESEIDSVVTVDDATKFVNRLRKHMEMEETLRTALPPVLAKEVKDRGGFDVMVVNQLKDTMTKRLAGLTEAIANAAPMREAAQKRVDEAQQVFASAKEVQSVAASTYMAASDAATGVERELRAAKDAMGKVKKELSVANEVVAAAEWSRDFFTDGPLSAFAFLKEQQVLVEHDGEAVLQEDTAPAPAVQPPVVEVAA